MLYEHSSTSFNHRLNRAILFSSRHTVVPQKLAGSYGKVAWAASGSRGTDLLVGATGVGDWEIPANEQQLTQLLATLTHLSLNIITQRRTIVLWVLGPEGWLVLTKVSEQNYKDLYKLDKHTSYQCHL